MAYGVAQCGVWFISAEQAAEGNNKTRPVILMDEPFGALDSQTRVVMQQVLLGIWEKEHKTVLFVTHDIDEALYLGEKVYVVSARPGRITDTIAVGFAHPRSYELATAPEFIELKRRIQHSLHAEVHKVLSSAA